jgi:hypothetical protein
VNIQNTQYLRNDVERQHVSCKQCTVMYMITMEHPRILILTQERRQCAVSPIPNDVSFKTSRLRFDSTVYNFVNISTYPKSDIIHLPNEASDTTMAI